MSAFIDGIVDFLQLRLSAIGCRRRHSFRDQLSTSREHRGEFLTPKSEILEQGPHYSKKRSDNDFANDSTDDLSTEGSDRETTSSQTPSNESQPLVSPPASMSARMVETPQRQLPPAFRAPPGLLAPKFGNTRPQPTNQALKQSHDNPSATMDAIKREMLNDVMGKLNSEDADLLKALFNVKQDSAAAPRAGERGSARNGFHEPVQRRSLGQSSYEIRRREVPAPICESSSLRSNLRRLATIDERRIVFVKKISKLGLNSSSFLKRYFTQFGSVEEVLCTHAIDKRSDSGKPRARPTNTGFVVFRTKEAAASALRKGSEHVVCDVCISVGAYQHQVPKEDRDTNGGDQQVSERLGW